MDDATTIRMANQIADFFKPYPAEVARKEIAGHINRFWVPQMRAAFFTLVAAGGAGLDPAVMAAAGEVRKPHVMPHEHEPVDHNTGLPQQAHEA